MLLILGEIWSKWSSLASLLLIEVFAEVAEVNADEALNIKACQRQQKLSRKSQGKMHFHIVTLAFYLPCQKLLKFEG